MDQPVPEPVPAAAARLTRSAHSMHRQRFILKALRSTGTVEVADISSALAVTTETVRKDLILLEQQGLLRRVHGGAVSLNELSFESDVPSRTQNTEEKVRIAQAALLHLPPQGSILIDAGSTTAKLAQLLPDDRALTVFTNALPIAMALVHRANLTVFTLGGRVRHKTTAEVDDWALRTLSEINVDVAFLGTNAISIARGCTTPDPAEAAVKRAMTRCARKRVLLADSSKVGMVSTCQHAQLEDIDLVITDSGLSSEHASSLRLAGLTVELA